MPQLMFRCPYTNKPIQSGIELVSENLKSVSQFPISLQCPHCGKQHHGTVALESTEGAGTVITLTLPSCPADRRGAPAGRTC